MAEKSLFELQQEILEKRAKILQNIDDERVRGEIADKLDTIRDELERVNELLEEVHASSNTPTPKKSKKTSRKTIRKRVNPEFARLGIPVPVGQRPGDELVKLGNKIKKNRKTRKS